MKHIRYIACASATLYLCCTSGCAPLAPAKWEQETRFIRWDTVTQTGTLNITSEPSGARVYIDDVPVGTTPCAYRYSYNEEAKIVRDYNSYYEPLWGQGITRTQEEPLGPEREETRYRPDEMKKSVSITLTKPGYNRASRRASLPEEQHINFFLSLTQDQPSQPPSQQSQQQQQQQQTVVIGGSGSRVSLQEKASVSLSSSPTGADVYIDGGFVGQTPIPGIALPVGTHKIRFEYAGFQPWERDINLFSGANIQVNATLRE